MSIGTASLIITSKRVGKHRWRILLSLVFLSCRTFFFFFNFKSFVVVEWNAATWISRNANWQIIWLLTYFLLYSNISLFSFSSVSVTLRKCSITNNIINNIFLNCCYQWRQWITIFIQFICNRQVRCSYTHEKKKEIQFIRLTIFLK